MSEEARTNYQPFPLTPWSLVGRAGDADRDDQRDWMDKLLQRYLPALRTHLIYGKRMRPNDADDLLQSFLADKVVERGIVGTADREKGRFRTFLLTALGRFQVSQGRKARALRRTPGAGGIVPFEECHEPEASVRPDRVFEVAWARQVVAEATRRTEAECRIAGREDVWGPLKARILDPALEAVEPLSYDELVRRYRLRSPLHCSNLLVTGRRMYVRNLRAVIAEYARDDEEVEQELRDLCSIVAEAGRTK